MLEDIIDIRPAIDAADECVAACREAARDAGVGIWDANALHAWVVSGVNGRDPILEQAVQRLYMRDAAWGAADFEQDPFERYTWELAAEIADEARSMKGLWFYSLGSFESCGASFEVAIHRPDDRCAGMPHFHVRMERHPRIPDVCIGIDEAVYVPFGHRRWELDHRHREDLANFLEALRYPGEAWPRWYEGQGACEKFREEDGIEVPPHVDFEHMPDYRVLRWPDGEEALA